MSQRWVEREVAGFLRTSLGELLVAAFLYGSVATGRATGTSDIDCFVVLREHPPRRAANHLRGSFTDLQRRLGFTPDPVHSLELFTVEDCRAAARGSTLATALDRYAATGMVSREVRESDDLEILRSLTGPRLPLIGGPVLDSLTDRARATVGAALAARPRLDPDETLAAFAFRTTVGRTP